IQSGSRRNARAEPPHYRIDAVLVGDVWCGRWWCGTSSSGCCTGLSGTFVERWLSGNPDTDDPSVHILVYRTCFAGFWSAGVCARFLGEKTDGEVNNGGDHSRETAGSDQATQAAALALS